MSVTTYQGRRLLTIEETGERLGVSRARVYELFNQNELPSVYVGRLRRVLESDLDAFIEGLPAEPAAS